MDSNRKWYIKEVDNVSLSTVSLEALLCTLIIDSHEWSDMDTFEIMGTYPYS